MRLNKQDEKELRRLADDMDSITQKLKAFRQSHGSLVGINITKEFVILKERLEELEKAFNAIPKIQDNQD